MENEKMENEKAENENKDGKNVVGTILKVIPLAMSVAVVALSILEQITPDMGIVMLGIGMFSGALAQLQK